MSETENLAAPMDRDEYPLRGASFVCCHAKPVAERFICEVCGDVTDSAGCKLGREVLP